MESEYPSQQRPAVTFRLDDATHKEFKKALIDHELKVQDFGEMVVRQFLDGKIKITKYGDKK